MLRRFRDAGLLGPLVATVAGLTVLIGLGTWQLKRKAWKDGLVAMIQERVTAAPVPLEEPQLVARALGQEEYRPVTVTGSFRHGDERHVFSVDHGEVGWDVYTPLETAGGNLLFVNRGFVPDQLKDPKTREAGQIAGQVTITGLVRAPAQHGWFEPDADVAQNKWFWRDLDGMAASLGDADVRDNSRPVLPFFIEQRAEPANPGGWPRGGVTRLDIPNRHLEYVLTWYGLALTLAGVFIAYAAAKLRERR